jgi:hypothetical protein
MQKCTVAEKTQNLTVSGRQAHSEEGFCDLYDQPKSNETWNALLSLGFFLQGQFTTGREQSQAPISSFFLRNFNPRCALSLESV